MATITAETVASSRAADNLGYYRKALAWVTPLPFLAMGVSYVCLAVPGDAPFPSVVRHVSDQIGTVHAMEWVTTLFFAFLIPAVIAIAVTTHRAYPRLTAVAVTMCVPSFALGMSLGPDDTTMAALTHTKHLDLATMTALDKAWQAEPVASIASLLFIVSVVFGLGMLGFALWRGRVVPAWAGIAFLFGTATHPFLGFSHVAQGIGLIVAGLAATQVSSKLLTHR